MRLFRLPLSARILYPGAVFRIAGAEKILCLTFDDGPDPLSTPVILDILRIHDVKAVFFCNGRNAEKFPGLITQIREEGHLTGNHGYDHFDGWRTKTRKYIDNVKLASSLTSDRLFRPPYGRLRATQFRELKKNFIVVMWDLMPWDFDDSFGKERSLVVLKRKIRPGSIIVLHDTTASSCTSIISEFIDYALDTGYQFILPEWTQKRV